MKVVSILVPVYNKSAYIETTLKTIRAQHTQGLFRLEVIIVDDLSTDDSLQKVQNFSWGNDISYRIIRNVENSGPAFSYNKALDVATGDYIVPLDSDDLLTNLGIVSRFNALEHNPEYDWVTGNELVIDEKGAYQPTIELVSSVKWLSNEELVDLLLSGKLVIPAQSLMIRAEAIKSVRWLSDMRSSQDAALNISLALAGHRLLKIDDYVAVYRTSNQESNNSLFRRSIQNGSKVKDFVILKDHIKDQLSSQQLKWLEDIIDRFTSMRNIQ